jgi:hypothetical protein
VLPETLQHSFPGKEYLRRLPNHIKDTDPDIPALKKAKAEYAKRNQRWPTLQLRIPQFRPIEVTALEDRVR